MKEYTNSAAINAQTAWRVPISDSDKARYTPFNGYTIHNDGGQEMKVRYEGLSIKQETIPSGGILELPFEDGLYYYNIDIYNTSATTAVAIGTIKVVVKKGI